MILEILTSIIAAAIDINMSNMTRDGIIRVAFNPYLAIFGNLTFGIIFGFIGAAVYANERSISTIITYLVLVGIFFAIVLPIPIAAIFGLILVFALSTVFYKTFVEPKN